jgi:tail lysozyme
MIVQVPDGNFEAIAKWCVTQLMSDFGLTDNQACGILGNLGFESNGFHDLQEVNPLAGRGGYGWGQYTGPRRISFLHFCTVNNIAPESNTGNFNYLEWELRNPGVGLKSLEELHKNTSLADCVFSFGRWYETPYGTTESYLPGFAGRKAWAQKALACYSPSTPAQPTTDSVTIAVMNLQRALNLSGIGAALAVDGNFGPHTYEEMMKWKAKQ